MRDDKRALSEVVTIMVVVVLALVAILIVWVVVQNLLSESEGQTSLEKLTIDLKIEKVKVDDVNNKLEVTVERKPGLGDLDKILFVVSDGQNSETFEKDSSISALEKETFILDITLNMANLKEISIAPVLKNAKGEITSTYNLGSGVETGTIEDEEEILSDPNLIAYWSCDNIDEGGNVIDDSGNGHDGIIQGTISSSAVGISGNACEFDGVNNYVDIDSADLGITTEITISAWVKTDVLDNNNHIVISKRDADGNFPWLLFQDTNNKINLAANDLNPQIGGATSLPSTNWHHVVGVIDTAGSYTVYINGITGTPTAIIGGNINEAGEDLYIGAQKVTAGMADFFKGKLDELMIFNRALTQEEVESLYLSQSVCSPCETGYTCNTETGECELGILSDVSLIHWYQFEGDATDLIGTADGTIEGDTNCNIAGQKDLACEFDGFGDRIVIPAGSNLITGTNPFTLSAWVNFADFSAIKNLLAVYGSTTAVQFYPAGGSKRVSLWACNKNLISIDYLSYLTNTWYYVTYTRDGNNWKVYINGIQIGSTIVDSCDLGIPSYNYNIGSEPTTLPSGGQWYNGAIDEVMIFNKALTQEEVESLYNYFQ